MSQEPLLSDVIAVHAADGAEETFLQFINSFRRSKLGVIALNLPSDASGTFVVNASQAVSIGLTNHAGGQGMALAFADPAVFAANFGTPFNAEVTGESLLEIVMHNADGSGVLVNSALSEISILIRRDTIATLVRSTKVDSKPPQKRWWHFW